MNQKTEKRKPLCIAPFVSLATWANGESVICCEDKGTTTDRLALVDDMSSLVNSERMCTTRKQFMNDEVPAGCSSCLEESNYQPTIYHYYKQHFEWKDFADCYDEATGTVSQTQYLLIALSNLCTYSCRMCFDTLSTQLSSDRHRMFGQAQLGYRQNDIEKIIRFIRSNPIRIVTFHGGNPINEPRFLDVLSELSSDTTVEILTNGSTLTSKGTDIRSHLERFKHVRFNLSLDGTRKTTEYIRVHSDFDAVFRHFTEVKELPNVSVNIHNTITNLNLFNLPAYYTMVLWGKFARADSISSYIATEPAILRVSNLPAELRQMAKYQLEDFLRVLAEANRPAAAEKLTVTNAYVRNVIRRLDSAPYDPCVFAEFLKSTKMTDDFYGSDPLPEYSYYLATDESNSSESTSQEEISPPNQSPYSGERSFNVSECTFGWTAAYHQNRTAITVRIQLVPDAGITPAQIAALQTTWENGIVNKWSGHFVCSGPYGNSSITFAVRWVTSNAHHVVRVRTGPAQSNMTLWDTMDNADVAAHEFGHMIGNPDEYVDAACPSRSPVSTGSVMDNNTGAALQRHVNRICASVGLLPDEHFSIGLDLI